MPLKVEVISDVICPWCYIGKRRLEKAIAALEGSQDVQVRWLPYQLNPQMPNEGMLRRDYRIRKFGTLEHSQELDARIVAVGALEGIQFNFDRIERTPNTLDAHRVIWLAEQLDVQDAVVESLFRAYFTEGRDISNRQALIDVVSEAGLNRSRAEAMLNSAEGLEAIQESLSKARQLGVDGVPCFIVNEKIMLGGAQPPDVFLDAFRQVVGSQ